MEEIISIHIGQSGIQAGNACWELFCLEHDIQLDGKLIQNSKIDDCKPIFFTETQSGQFIPRSVYFDLESNTINQVKTSAQKQLFNPEFLVSDNQDKPKTFARGYYQVSSQYMELCLDKIRKLAENCSNLQGFLIYNSAGGGTGSGYGSLLIEKIKETYHKKTNLGLTIFPSDQTQKEQIEPYNSVLCSQKMIEHGDVNLVLNNEALHDICYKNYDIQNPTYIDLNRVIAQGVSQLTCALRYDNYLQNHLSDFQMNLIPYPKFCFMLSSYSPQISPNTTIYTQYSTQEISDFLLKPQNMMAKCNPSSGKYMAVDIAYRGIDIIPKSIGYVFQNWKVNKSFQFTNWCKQIFKIQINYNLPSRIPESNFGFFYKSVFMISNSTSISQVLQKINNRFDQMFTKREFTQLYQCEGMEENELIQAREDLASLNSDYQDATETLEFEEEY
ncbi:hypothetical protein ABPG74_020177 [Tetrahymena malaccensis]